MKNSAGKSSPLPKSCLLTKPWQYNNVYKQGKRVRGKGFSLIFLPNNLVENRLGISVSGVRLAVRRNRLKRLIREFYRHNRTFPSQVAKSMGTSQVVDMVISTRKQFTPKDLQGLYKMLIPLTEK